MFLFSFAHDSSSPSDTQAYICSECDLLRVLMGKINRSNYDVSVSTQLPSKDSFAFSPRHSSIMGNVILIAHVSFLLARHASSGSD